MYAAKVKKTNMFEWTQERTLVITNNALYNIHKKSIKRVIEFKDIIFLLSALLVGQLRYHCLALFDETKALKDLWRVACSVRR